MSDETKLNIILVLVFGFVVAITALGMIHQQASQQETIRQCVKLCDSSADCVKACRIESEVIRD